ncbi:hypothetical protein CHLRE_02g095039v5 [Chlamydomonas reinhardtii]|uniref:Uncharacterized protein n=1 Tax=Chlamydomonas reinhardtii TaxID=3055 RepID=A0A2K3E1F6_CHLRE|nr:uncharacterized protein CHLRE_02g095039v5 [Chlamydomonas reinhardtii]XP_042927141.1 uncharacterized protein CHLRE_02g095039v5 [Chlamydomonas reinhardtii]PNW86649.1 hypothetical protein CHLRE_02g095039v5 [Chlamydomonas reinhardtii]PNW86650.1 hypothetical protein CHLRE_02g095039v5 [Chlamydomonas reinhardtii]
MYYHRHRTLGRAMRSVRSVELADELRGLGMGSSAGTSLKSGSSTSTSERGLLRLYHASPASRAYAIAQAHIRAPGAGFAREALFEVDHAQRQLLRREFELERANEKVVDLEERLASATDTITELRETHEMAEGELAFAHNENDALRQHQQETVNHLLETFQAYQKQQAEFAQLTAMFANELQMRLTYILPSDAGLIASRACNGHAAADSMVVPGLQEFGLPTMYDNIAQFLPVLRMVEAAFARFVVDFRPHIVSAVRDYLRNNPLAPFDGEASWHAA